MNGLHLLLGAIAATALIGWAIDNRRARRAEQLRAMHERIATEKSRRLLIALGERDRARAHADDAQLLANSIITGDHRSRDRHPTNVRVLRPVEERA